MVFITGTDRVYCAVRTVYLNIIQVNFPHRGRCRFDPRSNKYEICGRQSGSGEDFVASDSVSAAQSHVISVKYSAHITNIRVTIVMLVDGR